MTQSLQRLSLPALIPAPGLIWAMAGFMALGVVVAIAPGWLVLWQLTGLGLLMLALTDALWLCLQPPPAVKRTHAHALSLGSDSEVRVRIDNHGRNRRQLQVFDHAPPQCQFDSLPQTLDIAAGGYGELLYRLRPLRRGEWSFGPVQLRLRSVLGLWWRGLLLAQPGTVRVYPNFSALQRYALLATDHRLSQLGVLRRRRRGEGMDFHQLREYRQGDAPRQIDWKASARMHRLVSREYRDERDQQIVVLLDCGRRMSARDGPISHLDHALNAALLLAYVALRQGDAVGIMTMAGVERWVPPRKSSSGLNALLAQVYDIESTLVAPDYYAAAVNLMRQQRKRSLVVWISNLRDEDDDGLRAGLMLLRQRHLVVLASLRERLLDDVLQAPIHNLDEALTHAATAQYLGLRRRQFARLEQARIPCIDVEPQALPIALVNRYTDLKRAGAI